MTPKYVLEKRYKTIIPFLPTSQELVEWAKDWPNMYTIYTAGYITYYNDAALSWFIMRWGESENAGVSLVSLG